LREAAAPPVISLRPPNCIINLAQMNQSEWRTPVRHFFALCSAPQIESFPDCVKKSAVRLVWDQTDLHSIASLAKAGQSTLPVVEIRKIKFQEHPL
jgi:hypothetical protein